MPPLPPSGAHTLATRQGVCVGEVWRTLGCLWASWSHLQARPFWRFVGGPSNGVYKRLVGSVPFGACQALLAVPPASPQIPHPQLYSSPQYSGCGEKEVCPFGSVPHSWGAGHSRMCSPFLLEEKLQTEGTLLALSCAALGEGRCSETVSLPSSMHPILDFLFLFFLLQGCIRTSPLDSRLPQRYCLSWVLSKSVFFEGKMVENS